MFSAFCALVYLQLNDLLFVQLQVLSSRCFDGFLLMKLVQTVQSGERKHIFAKLYREISLLDEI